MVIDESIIQQYEADGAVCIRNAVPQERAATILDQLEVLKRGREDRWTTIRSGGFSDRYLWPSFQWMSDFCKQSNLQSIAAAVMRSRAVNLYADHVFIRDAGTDQTTPWHQDLTYWPFQGSQMTTVWVALTACKPDSSALRIVKGSHQWGKKFRPVPFSKDSGSDTFLDKQQDLETAPDIDGRIDEFEILAWDMQPGDAIVFSAAVLHGAKNNAQAAEARAAISVRYFGDDVRWDPRPGTDPVAQDKVSFIPGDHPSDDQWLPKVFP